MNDPLDQNILNGYMDQIAFWEFFVVVVFVLSERWYSLPLHAHTDKGKVNDYVHYPWMKTVLVEIEVMCKLFSIYQVHRNNR